MRLIVIIILMLFGFESYSQDSTNQNESKFLLDNNSSLRLEGSMYLSENLHLNNTFDRTSGIIFNLAIKVSNNVLLGLTTQDTEVNNETRNISHFLLKYNFSERENEKLYFSIKIPSSQFTKIENDQLKFLRAGLGCKIKIREIEKSTIYFDINHDYMFDWDDKTIFNPVMLIGFSISNIN